MVGVIVTELYLGCINDTTPALSTQRCFLTAGSYIFTMIDIFHNFHGNQHGVFFLIRHFDNIKYLQL